MLKLIFIGIILYVVYRLVTHTPIDTRLVEACSKEETREDAFRLIKSNPELINVANKEGITPLMVAARKGYVDIMRELLAAGAKKNATNRFDCTALIEAVIEGRVEAVKLLLSHKVRIEDDKWSALNWACRWSNNEDDQVTIAQALLDAGANVNYVERSGETPLMKAAFYGKPKVTALLLKRGADPYKTDRNGNALQIAKRARVELFRHVPVSGMCSKEDYDETIRILTQAMK